MEFFKFHSSVFYLNRDLKTRLDLNVNLTIFIGTVSYGFTAVVARDLSIPALFGTVVTYAAVLIPLRRVLDGLNGESIIAFLFVHFCGATADTKFEIMMLRKYPRHLYQCTSEGSRSKNKDTIDLAFIRFCSG